MQDGAAHLQHTLLFANNELLGVRTLVSARNLRIDTIHHQFSTTYRGSVVLTRSEYQLGTALNSLSSHSLNG
jgi:hypothetical protein